MKFPSQLFLLFGLLCLNFVARAEGGCPPGMIPEGGQGVMSCRPIPGYDQGQGQSRPQAPPMRWASKWGAVATDSTVGSLGDATNFDSQNEAESAALADCKAKGGSHCKLQTWYSNGCAAMILGNTGFNVGNASTLNEAIEKGTKVCKDAGDTNCHVYYSACSLPQRIQ